MRPLDPRLLRYARSTRGFLVFAIMIGALTALVVILQARLVSTAIVSLWLWLAYNWNWWIFGGSIGVVFLSRFQRRRDLRIGAAHHELAGRDQHHLLADGVGRFDLRAEMLGPGLLMGLGLSGVEGGDGERGSGAGGGV